MKQTALALN
jgi:uncharacterized protein with von Willebrand factor type A (vWA) domain